MIRTLLFSLIATFAFSGCRTKNEAVTPVSPVTVTTADSGMVVSAHPAASAIGIEILKKGGNAVDAAVATEFALAVCYPGAGNLGGGGFMLYREADGRTDFIDYREKSPLGSERDMYLDAMGNVIAGLSTETHLSAGVPGTVDGMINMHAKYGILQFRDVIQPAIDLAENGFRVTAGQAADLNGNRETFIGRNLRPPAFVKDAPWNEGDTMRQHDLARTLMRIRDLGRDGFYSGTTARLILKEMKRGNGIITQKDLNEYASVFRDPLSAEYRGCTIITAPPPSGGGVIILQILGMLEPYDVTAMGFHSLQSVHIAVEAARRAYADRAFFLGDPDYNNIPVNELLNKDYLNKRMSTFDSHAASPSESVFHGAPLSYESEETTHYSVVDSKGNAVSATTTLNNTFGSGIVVDSAGFLLNNEMDDFSVKPGVPNMFGLTGSEANSVSGGKRMLSSMSPVVAVRDGKLFLVAGSPGGATIPTSVLQVLMNVIDFGMNISQAVDTGRFHHQWLPDKIYYETGALDQGIIEKLRNTGHEMEIRKSIGRVNAIMMVDGKMSPGADKRGMNAAAWF